MEITYGKYKVGTKVWLSRNGDKFYQRVLIVDNRVMLGNVYHGYTVKVYSESFDKYYLIGAVCEDDLTYRKRY